MELIDCKALLLCQQINTSSERVESIGLLLHRNEMLLKTYNYYEEEMLPSTSKEEKEMTVIMAELQQLQQVTIFQEKTIQQLKLLRPAE